MTETAETADLELEDGFEDTSEEPVVEPAKPDSGAAETARLREQIAEAEANAKYWHEQAKTAPRTAAAAKPAAKLSESMVDAISSEDPERIRKALGELGFVSTDEVDRRVNAKANVVVTEQQLLAAYPDLNDPKSDFYRATAVEYQRLIADPDMARSPNTMRVAAELARAKSGPTKTTESESERAARVSRQSGGGSRRATRAATPEEEQLSSGQRSIVEKFMAAGAPITEEAYKKRAFAGVKLGGSLGRRARA